jgi:phospholipase D1/2
MTNPRFQFLFDDCPLAGGSHHQKFVVIDGVVSYLGGMDVCEARWDDRHHFGRNRLRRNRGAPSMPYHDVQSYFAGRKVGRALEDLFWERWTNAGGEKPAADEYEEPARPFRPRGLIPLGRARIALSRTEPCPEDRPTIREIERLLVDAIESASRSIYVETQYFSSRRLCQAFEARMRDARKPRLEIAVVVNERAEKLKEEIAVGLRQAENLQRLRRVAAETGHALGLYYSLCEGITEEFRATYIHSKVMIVDDRFLTVGSANFTNRSMGLDSELHASWEAAANDVRLRRSIRRVRVSLLAEHGGLSGIRSVRRLGKLADLVARLDEIAARPGARLQIHGPPTLLQAAVMSVLDPQDLPFDPEIPEASSEADRAETEAGASSARSWLDETAACLWRLASSASPFGHGAGGKPLSR